MRDWRSTPLEWLAITRDLDLGSGHTAYGRASLIDLYLHTKFHWNRKNFFLDGLTAGPLQVQGHVTQKLGQISKIWPDQIEILCCSLRISGHLPAPCGWGDRLWKVQFSELQKPRDLDVDLESGHTAYRYVSLIDLHVHTKFHWNRTNFLSYWERAKIFIIFVTFCRKNSLKQCKNVCLVRTDRWTYLLTDEHFPPLTLLGRLGGVDLIINICMRILRNTAQEKE